MQPSRRWPRRTARSCRSSSACSRIQRVGHDRHQRAPARQQAAAAAGQLAPAQRGRGHGPRSCGRASRRRAPALRLDRDHLRCRRRIPRCRSPSTVRGRVRGQTASAPSARVVAQHDPVVADRQQPERILAERRIADVVDRGIGLRRRSRSRRAATAGSRKAHVSRACDGRWLTSVRRPWRVRGRTVRADRRRRLLDVEHADQGEQPPRGVEIHLDLAVQALLEQLGGLVVERRAGPCRSPRCPRGAVGADRLEIGFADREIVADRAAEAGEADADRLERPRRPRRAGRWRAGCPRPAAGSGTGPSWPAASK